MMADFADLALLREQMIEMAAPAGWIFPGAITTRPCPIQHALNSPSQPRGRLGLGLPHRLKHLEHKPGVDMRHGEAANHRIRGGERRSPLGAMLRIPPFGFVGGDISRAGLAERHRSRRLKLLARAFLAARFDGIDPVEQPLASQPGPFARLLQRDGVRCAQAHVTGSAAEHEAKDPARRPALAHFRDL
jgi:hypothetical protein